MEHLHDGMMSPHTKPLLWNTAAITKIMWWHTVPQNILRHWLNAVNTPISIMEAADSSQVSVHIQQATWCHIPNDSKLCTHQWRTDGGWFGGFGVQQPPPPRKFRRPSKIMPNSTWLWILLKIAEFKMPTPQDVWKKGSKILKLPKFAIVLH